MRHIPHVSGRIPGYNPDIDAPLIRVQVGPDLVVGCLQEMGGYEISAFARKMGVPEPRFHVDTNRNIHGLAYRMTVADQMITSGRIAQPRFFAADEYSLACAQARSIAVPPATRGINDYRFGSPYEDWLPPEGVVLSDVLFRLARILPALLPFGYVQDVCRGVNIGGLNPPDPMLTYMVMMELLEEGVPITNTAEVLFACVARSGDALSDVAEAARFALRRDLLNTMARTAHGALLCAGVGERFSALLQKAAADSLTLCECVEVSALRRRLQSHTHAKVAIIVPTAARRLVRSWMRQVAPEVRVLAAREIAGYPVHYCYVL